MTELQLEAWFEIQAAWPWRTMNMADSFRQKTRAKQSLREIADEDLPAMLAAFREGAEAGTLSKAPGMRYLDDFLTGWRTAAEPPPVVEPTPAPVSVPAPAAAKLPEVVDHAAAVFEEIWADWPRNHDFPERGGKARERWSEAVGQLGLGVVYDACRWYLHIVRREGSTVSYPKHLKTVLRDVEELRDYAYAWRHRPRTEDVTSFDAAWSIYPQRPGKNAKRDEARALYLRLVAQKGEEGKFSFLMACMAYAKERRASASTSGEDVYAMWMGRFCTEWSDHPRKPRAKHAKFFLADHAVAALGRHPGDDPSIAAWGQSVDRTLTCLLLLEPPQGAGMDSTAAVKTWLERVGVPEAAAAGEAKVAVTRGLADAEQMALAGARPPC